MVTTMSWQKLFQDPDGARQFLVVKGAAPFSVVVAIGHATESRSLDHEKFQDKRRYAVAFAGGAESGPD